MNTSRRKLILGFSIFLGVVIVSATGVLAYAAHQMQLARFGDIFDLVVSQQTQTWVVPTLIAIAGISIVGFLLFIGLYLFLEPSERTPFKFTVQQLRFLCVANLSQYLLVAFARHSIVCEVRSVLEPF